jgi:DNA polymerase delta subunit 1
LQNVFTLNGCLPIVGSQVITSDTEEEMLLKWRAFLIQSDPDILTGYNVQNFDIPYLLDRAETLGKRQQQQNRRKTSSSSTSSRMMQGFRQWGRIRTGLAKMRETMFQSAAYESSCQRGNDH